MVEYGYFQEYDSEQFSFFRIPKMMITDTEFASLSLEAVFLYGILLDRTALSRKNGWVDEQGRVYIIYPLEEIMALTGRCKNKILSLLRELVKNGLLERIRQGNNRPNIMYVKNFSRRVIRENGDRVPEHEPKYLEVHDMNSQRFKLRTSGGSQNELPEVHKMNPSNTNINKTDISKNERVKERFCFGKFLNVFLTQKEIDQFKADYPDQWRDMIGRLSEYMASSGKRYENHYATLCLWASREKQEKKIRNYEDTEVMHL